MLRADWKLLIAILFLSGLASATPADFPTRWSKPLPSTHDKGSSSWHFRDVGPDTAVMSLSNYGVASRLLVFNTTNGDVYGNMTVAAPFTHNGQAMSTTNEGLVAHFGMDWRYCVSRGASLDKLWCTPFTSSCFNPVGFSSKACTFTLTASALFVVENGTVRAFVPESGRQLWKASFTPGSAAQMASIAASHNQVVVSLGGIFAFSAATGAHQFSFGTDSHFNIAEDFAFTSHGNIAVNNFYCALLLSPSGQLIQNYTFPSTMGAYVVEVLVHPFTSELYTVTINEGFLLSEGILPHKGAMVHPLVVKQALARRNVNKAPLLDKQQQTVGSPIENNYPGSIVVIGTDNKQKWFTNTFSTIGDLHLDEIGDAVYYTETSGIYKRDMETGKLLASATALSNYNIPGQPWISKDRKTLLAGSYYFNDSGAIYEMAMGFVLE